ncbi:MAG: ECF transporter S component [Microthrixaceae bacterium]
MTAPTNPAAPANPAAAAARPVLSVGTQRAIALRPRSVAVLALTSLVGVMAYLWPFLAAAPQQGATASAHAQDAVVVMGLLLPLLVLVTAVELGEGGFDARAVGLLGVLTAAGAALRMAGGGVTGFSPMFFLIVLAGSVLGSGFGFVLGATTMFASAIITGGIGPWLPFQMFAMAWIGAGAGWLPGRGTRAELWVAAAYGALTGIAYGALLNLWSWPFAAAGAERISYQPGAGIAETVRRYWAFYLATSLGWDLTRAVGTVVVTLLVGPPVLVALRRAAKRAHFVHS